MASDKTVHRPTADHDRHGGVANRGSKAWRVLSVAGLNLTGGVREALHDVGMQHATLVRYHAQAEPPYTCELLRIEGIDGTPLGNEQVSRSWHRPPYALPVRLARYAPCSAKADVLDVAVIGTRGKRREFAARVESTAARLIEDAIIGVSRGPADLSLDTNEMRSRHRSRPGKIDHVVTAWHARLFSEWWSVGRTTTPLANIVRTGSLGRVQWLSPDRGHAYLADPFPWPETNKLLCEEMPFAGGSGRIVALAPGEDGTWHNASVVLQSRQHHSYPCAVRIGEDTFFLPEATSRGATTLYRLVPNGKPMPLCAVAPGRRLADPTLFIDAGRYWIACTDLDIGLHDNLCLLHADAPTGPWQPHRCNPVKIDICGARPAGPVFRLGQQLFRPGQDCASTYGAAVVIHRINTLSPQLYEETVVTRLRPDPLGPFPHGLHTLAADQEQVWVDGKRFVFDFAGLNRRIMRFAGLAGHEGNAGT